MNTQYGSRIVSLNDVKATIQEKLNYYSELVAKGVMSQKEYDNHVLAFDSLEGLLLFRSTRMETIETKDIA